MSLFSNYALFQTNKDKILSISQKQNIQSINVFIDKNTIAIQKKIHAYTQSNKNVNDFLVIDRKTEDMKVMQTFDTTNMTKRVFSAFLGVAIIKGIRFLVLCDQAKISTNVQSILIYEVASLYFLCYQSDKQLSAQPLRKQIFQEIRELYQIIRIGFYFSYKHNLTQSFQNQQMGVKNRFTWNIRFMKELEKYHIDKEWCIPLIQGYVNSFDVFVEGTKISYILISRRSNKKAGTRYFDRGVDEEGYVANFVHTQQIIKIDDYLISDGQIRGSVPIFFQQKGLRTLIKLTRGYQLTHQIYNKHMQKLKDTFRRVFFVNLLSRGKRGQKMIIEQLQKHMKQQKVDKNIKYMYFDFHKAVQNGDYSKVDQGIDKVRQMKTNLGFYIYDTNKNQVLDTPEGIFRTNCLDCLDRTNFFQAKMALISLQNIFQRFNITTQNLLQVMNSGTQQNDLIKKFRNIWADNGDMISYHYTGTGSTHTDITRDGKRGITGEFKHKYKSITRFYNQNFWDFHKMNLVDLLLDQKTGSQELNRLPTMVKNRQNEYIKKHLLDIYIFSWKVPAKPPKSLILFPTSSQVIAISLQQVSEVQKWSKLITQSIHSSYILIGQKFSNNNLIKIYIKEEYKKMVSNVELTKVKFKSYFNQYMSTKCAVIIRFTYASSKIVFCGCQLEYGRQFSANRIKNLKDLHEYAFQEVKVGEKKLQNILGDDVIFLVGNMNTHVEQQWKQEFNKFRPQSLGKLRIQNVRLIQNMIQTDQFYSQIKQSLLEFREYEEQQIQFPPTYKFNGSAFESQKSGWPDRIWFSTSNKIICSDYSTIEELRDSHVPVVGSFQVEVDEINEEIKDKILQEIVKNNTSTQSMESFEVFQKLQDNNTQTVEGLETPFFKHQK